MSWLSDLLSGGTSSGTSTQTLSTLTSEQQTALADILPYLYSQATTSPQLGGTNEYLENYFTSNIEQPLTEQYETEVIPGIRESTGTLHSSSTANQIQEANTDLANQLSSAKSNLYWQNYQSELAQQQNSLASLLTALGVSGTENVVSQEGLLQSIFGSGYTNPLAWFS